MHDVLQMNFVHKASMFYYEKYNEIYSSKGKTTHIHPSMTVLYLKLFWKLCK